MAKTKNKEFTPKSLSKNWLQLLDYGGCSPINQSFAKKIINSIYIILCSSVIFLCIIELISTKFKNLSQITKTAIIVVGYMQVTTKFIICRIKHKILAEMIDIMWNKFWSFDSLNNKAKIKLLRTYKFINITTKAYCAIILGSIFSIINQAMLTKERTLPLDVWLPYKEILKKSPYFEILYIFEVLFMFSHDLFLVAPVDALFTIMIGLVYCQFNVIKENLMKIGIGDRFEDKEILKKCVEHHNLLLQFLEMLESVYSNAILLIISSGLCLATLNLYAIVMEDDNSLKVLFVVLYICILSQLYFYCQAGQIIQDEAESVGNAAYNCNWINISNKSVTNGLQLIILRSQKRFNITAGGFMILNLENFANVVQTSFSFLTFLESFKS